MKKIKLDLSVVFFLPLVVGDVLVLHWDVKVNSVGVKDVLQKQRQNVQAQCHLLKKEL